jgi:hypothetical protein
MKKSIAIITILMIIQMNAPVHAQESAGNKEELFGLRVMNTLKQNDAVKLMNLFPTLAELHELMDANGSVYSTTLGDAKVVLTEEYKKNVLPGASSAFQTVLARGKEKGIDWSAIQSIEVLFPATGSPSNLMHIKFYSNGTPYILEIKKFTNVQGQLRITQFIKFI